MMTFIQVHDPNGRKYIFRCNCWLTTLKYKRLIDLSEIEGERPIGLDSDETLSMGTRSTRVFPLTITILFLLLVLITFTYFGNEICKKWRDNFLFFNSSNSLTQTTNIIILVVTNYSIYSRFQSRSFVFIFASIW